MGNPGRLIIIWPGIAGQTTKLGLGAISEALANCPPLSAERSRSVGVTVGSEDGALSVSVRIRSVVVNLVIRADSRMISEYTDVSLNEHLEVLAS